MDWRELFWKYVETVGEVEGVTFLDKGKWTPEELKNINELGRMKDGRAWIEVL